MPRREYEGARKLLREGGLASLRLDLDKTAIYFKVQRPTFAQFEGLAVVGGLDSFDNAMRAMQQGNVNVTAQDVKTNAKAAVNALEEVLYLFGGPCDDKLPVKEYEACVEG